MTFESVKPSINALWADLIIDELFRLGIDYFVISPGSRSTPLTMAVARHDGAVECVHFDERGAAFHALGYARATGKPSVVISTSGTATANYFPAVIEASMDRVPLILLTSDRPPELRQVGANQTIDQVNLYGNYTRRHIDLPCPDASVSPRFVVSVIDQSVACARRVPRGPVHINCMFREPLAPPDESVDFSEYLSPLSGWLNSKTPLTEYAPAIQTLKDDHFDHLAEYLNNVESGLIFVGSLTWGIERDRVIDLVRRMDWPVIPDVLSGMRLGIIDDNIIPYSDILLMARKQVQIDSPQVVLHFGGRPTSERVQAFLGSLRPDAYIQVCDHADRQDPNSVVTNRLTCTIGRFVEGIRPQITSREIPPLWPKAHLVATKQAIMNLLDEEFSMSEPAVCRMVSRNVVDQSALFLSNSLPIREMNSFAAEDGPALPVAANRGASGIDGVVAAAVGYARGLRMQVTLVIGDLALLHDLNSLAFTRRLREPMTIVLLNNNGGGIFNLLPIVQQHDVFERFFGTPHDLNFEQAAKMFGLEYFHPDSSEEFVAKYRAAQRGQRSAIIEVTTDRNQTADIYRTLKGRVIEALSQ